MNLTTRIAAFGKLITRLFRRPVTVRDTFGFIAAASRGLPRREETRCTGCGACMERCSSGATTVTDTGNQRTVSIDSLRCIFCARCADVCPEGALDLKFDSVLSDSQNRAMPMEPGWLCINEQDLDPAVSDRYAGLISHSHGIQEKGETVNTTLTLQTCPICGEVMPVTENFLQVISKRVLENLQPDSTAIVKKDMGRYLTACISCRRKMSGEWNTHPRKFI